MAQTFTDDLYEQSHVADTTLSQMEQNFAALKSCFSGGTAPTTTVAGMWWLDTAADLLKIRNEANTAWIEVWNFSNYKAPHDSAITDSLTDSCITTDKVNALAITGPKLAAATITSDKIAADVMGKPAAGTVCLCGSANTGRSVSAGSWTKIKDIEVSKTGSYRVEVTVSNIYGPTYTRIYVNGVAYGAIHSTGAFNENVSVTGGDNVQLYGYETSGSSPYDSVTAFEIKIANPVSTTVVMD